MKMHDLTSMTIDQILDHINDLDSKNTDLNEINSDQGDLIIDMERQIADFEEKLKA